MRFFLVLFFLTFVIPLKGQTLPKFTVDLEKEMRYMVNDGDVWNRGEKAFKADLIKNFKSYDHKYDSFLKKSFLVFFEINFDQTGQATIGLFDSSLMGDKLDFETYLQGVVSKLIKNFKPALYRGELIRRSYSIQFRLSLKDQELIVRTVLFEPSITFKVDNGACFKSIKVKEGQKELTSLFYNYPIKPEYDQGISFLRFEINRTFKDSVLLENVTVKTDSLVIPFVIFKNGYFGLQDSILSSNDAIQNQLVQILIRKSCNWKSAVFSGRPVNAACRFRFVYNYITNENGDRQLIFIKEINELTVTPKNFMIN